MNNATYLYNSPPIPNPSQQLDLSSSRQLLFPSMKFFCGGGTIRRFTFLGWLNESSEQLNVTRLTSWPHFSLWHRYNGQPPESRYQIGPEYHDQLIENSNIINNQILVVEVNFTTGITFNQDDILGIRLQQCDPPISRNGIDMTVLKRSGIYGQTLVCDINECNTRTDSLFQYL